jgi:hypothetical protein
LAAARLTGTVPEQVITEAFRFIALTFVVVEELKLFNVIANPPVSNVPARIVGEPPPVIVTALPNVQPPPTPLKFTVIGPNVILLVVTVLPVVVAKKFIAQAPVLLNVTPVAPLNQLPYTLIFDPATDVMVTLPTAGPAMLTSRQVAGVAVRPIVTA